ncbi:tripartite tricarboxylate transporter substrate binding protein [Neomegalonema sp.]|uniref:Bug family tripartite tricarboxylate transporter substrate binding protein n=1 Tax=Neomegalonema sp. TaxID=2039713 RepID=UPI0026377072|nr:tripartite tricarboxylate transporter substrate-binding protein [Neomegalonema sp.]MDD2867133.1 tripartite tricarboxylate transporter substrate-binding protein [Neomegalonema sp.]
MSNFRSLRSAVAAAALGLALATGAAPAFAAEDLTITVPANPGGGWDQTGRAMAEVLQGEKLARSVEVDNVAGAGGTIGLAQFASRPGEPDALLVMGLVMTGAILTNNSPVTLESTTPLARLTSEYEGLVVPADSPLKTVGELVEKLKADPASVSWGGGSAGGTDHILAGLVMKAVGADTSKLNYVAHSGGGEALASILGGHVTVGVSGVGEFVEQAKTGKLRFLAVSSDARIDGVEAPTLAESGVDVVLGNWRGVVGAPDIDDEERAALLVTLDAMAATEAWKKILSARGWTDAYLSGDAFAEFLKEDDARVVQTLKDIGLVE